MDSICIRGGIKLQGKVGIQGSKNAALPVLAATLLTEGENILYNCPRIQDICRMQQMMKSIGCLVTVCSDSVSVDATDLSMGPMPAEAIQSMRSSLYMLGALLARCGEVIMNYPGGCVIGKRPIDLHMEALQKMGVCFEEYDGMIRGQVQGRLHGAAVCFPRVSVGATENVILAGVLAEGTTHIENAAREPEVVTLCEYLNACGAEIRGIGSTVLDIFGVSSLKGCSFQIPADRIVAGTYLFAAVASGGCVLLENAPCAHMQAVLDLAERMGCICQTGKEGLYVQVPEVLQPVEYLKTEIYPGFPTDLQSAALAALLKSPGESLVEETIFEDRFHIIDPLNEMGAGISRLDRQRARVPGPVRLQGRSVRARELRGGAALVIAGLAAQGVTVVSGCEYIMRGYENICKDFRELGARIVSV